MASMTMTKARECPDCGGVHDCAWLTEMTILCERLDRKISELVEYVNACDKAGLSTPEIHPMEDK